MGRVEDDALLREAEACAAELEDELESARGLLEEIIDEIERLRDVLERRRDRDDLPAADNDKRCQQLKAANDELRAWLEASADEKDKLADEIDALCLELKSLRRQGKAASISRSQSCMQILETQALEDDLNAGRDKLAGDDRVAEKGRRAKGEAA